MNIDSINLSIRTVVEIVIFALTFAGMYYAFKDEIKDANLKADNAEKNILELREELKKYKGLDLFEYKLNTIEINVKEIGTQVSDIILLFERNRTREENRRR